MFTGPSFQIKLHLLSSLTQWISKLPGSFEIHWVRQYLVNYTDLMGIVNAVVYKTANFHRCWAWQIVLIFNTEDMFRIHQQPNTTKHSKMCSVCAILQMHCMHNHKKLLAECLIGIGWCFSVSQSRPSTQLKAFCWKPFSISNADNTIRWISWCAYEKMCSIMSVQL